LGLLLSKTDMASSSPSASKESGKDDEEEGHPMPPFPIKSPTTGNDLPSMRKELREQLQLAIVRARERTKRDEETRTDGRAEGRAEDEDDDIGRLTSSLEGLVAVADGNLSVLVTGDKRFATTQFAFECIERMDPQRVSVTVSPDFANTKEFDVVIIFVDSESVLEVLEETKLVAKRVGSENVFIAAFVKEEDEDEDDKGGEEREMRAALESVRSSDSVMPSEIMPTKEEDEEYSDAQIKILRNARGTKRDVEKNAAKIPELSSRDAPITEFERQTLAIQPIEMSSSTINRATSSSKKSPSGGGQFPMKISFPNDQGDEGFLRAEAMLWNVALSSGIDQSNACAFEHGGKSGKKNMMMFHRREQIEWVKGIERALEKIEESRLRQVKSQLANIYVEASGLDAVEVGLISPEKRGKRENPE